MSKRKANKLTIPNYSKRRRCLTTGEANADQVQVNLRPDDELLDLDVEGSRLPAESRAASGSVNRVADALLEMQSDVEEVSGEGEDASWPMSEVNLKGLAVYQVKRGVRGQSIIK